MGDHGGPKVRHPDRKGGCIATWNNGPRFGGTCENMRPFDTDHYRTPPAAATPLSKIHFLRLVLLFAVFSRHVFLFSLNFFILIHSVDSALDWS